MSKLLVIMGATGNQGSSVLHTVLSSPSLSKTYTIRALTRTPSSPSAQSLTSLGIQVCACDPSSPSSLLSAFQGAHTIFAMTTSLYDGSTHGEISQGKSIVDAAIAASATYIIWSTLPSPFSISKGKYKNVTGFDDKFAVEEYLRAKSAEGLIRSSFFAPGSFMQNFAQGMKPALNSQAGDGSYAIFRPVKPEAKMPLVDIRGDTGKFVGAILADEGRFEGKTVLGVGEVLSMREQAEVLSKATGREVRFVQIPVEVFKGFLPEGSVREELTEMLLFQEECGYFGDMMEEGVRWSLREVERWRMGEGEMVGRVKGLGEWLEENPLVLE